MAKQQLLKKLLQANPKAKTHERVLRETLRDLEELRNQGFGGGEYRLVVPFGDKRQLRANEGLSRRYSK